MSWATGVCVCVRVKGTGETEADQSDQQND